eukprot:8889473-Prorocentrum_lima.AAC.1
MTSSLVGSEMCIRDRDCTTGVVYHKLRPRRSCQHQANCVSNGQGPIAPVSYTHLTLPTICSV